MEQKFTLTAKKSKKMSNKKKSSVIIVTIAPFFMLAEPKTNYNADEPRFLLCDDTCESVPFKTLRTSVFNDYDVDNDRFLF